MTEPRRVRTQAERAGDDHTWPRPRIVVDPAVRWGRPHIEGKRTATVDVAGMVAAGETVSTVADEYGLTRHEVLLACWHEGMDGNYQALLGAWARMVHEALASRQSLDVNALPVPPADETCQPPHRRWWHRLTRRNP